MTNSARDDHRMAGAAHTTAPPNATAPPDATALPGAATASPDAPETELAAQEFEERDLHVVRQTVTAHSARVLPGDRADDMALIAIELASNAIRHGGGRGRLRLWMTPDAIYCQVSDDGPGFPDGGHPVRQRPEPSASSGRGLWLVLHFSDGLTVENDVDGGATVTAMIALGEAASPKP